MTTDALIIKGDCLNVMAGLPDGSIDAIVTDPPYGLGFLGKNWDRYRTERRLRRNRTTANRPRKPETRAFQLIHIGDCLEVMKTLDEKSVQTCVTSPPYWGLRDYGVDGQLGLEKTPDEYVAKMVAVFREVRRVLKDDGTLWLNLGDTYAANRRGGGSDFGGLRGMRSPTDKPAEQYSGTAPDVNIPPGLKPKDLVGIPWRVAFALQADGWWLRQDIIWHKPNPMPESVTDRCTKAHEYIFLLSKADRYYYNADAVKEPNSVDYGSDEKYIKRAGNPQKYNDGNSDPKGGGFRGFGGFCNKAHTKGRNRRSVWTVSTRPFKEAHFATYPPQLIEPCILAGSREGDTVLDPFNGAGTTGLVAHRHGREYVGIELNPEYAEIAKRRIEHERKKTPLFSEVI